MSSNYSDLTPTGDFIYFFKFIKNRMDIFWNRLEGKEQPWTDDEILQKYKFTNVYRCLDRTSQYLIKNVIYSGVKCSDVNDAIFRILFFKLFNKIATWELFNQEFGEIHIDLVYGRYDKFDSFVKSCLKQGIKLYSNAYVLSTYVEDDTFHHSKYMTQFKKNIFFNKDFLRVNSLQGLYDRLTMRHVGKFLAYQFSIDLNYSQVFNFDENEFVMAGPGAERGIQQTFRTKDYERVIRYVQEHYERLAESHSVVAGVDLKARFLNRFPTLIDIQNCFCETDKYLRQVNKDGCDDNKRLCKKMKKKFVENTERIEYVFPPKWNMKLSQSSCVKNIPKLF